MQFVLPVGRESGSTEGQSCNLYCLRCVIRAVQRGGFAFCTAHDVRFGQYRRVVLQFVLPAVCDLSSTEKDFAFSTAYGS